jgi:uncharacterized protein (TIGR02246 family)
MVNDIMCPLDRLAGRWLASVAGMSDDERAIREIIDTWLAASAEGDSATLLSLMADDVVFLTPEAKPFGKREFAEGQASLASVKVEAAADVKEVRVSGDLGFAWSHLTVKTTVPDAPTIKRSGYSLSVFQRLPNTRWVLARDANLVTVEV